MAKAWWQQQGYDYGRRVGPTVDDKWVCVTRLIPGTAKLILADFHRIYGSWTYPSLGEALGAAAVWDGLSDPPVGWIRDDLNHRRREGGDPDKEEIRP